VVGLHKTDGGAVGGGVGSPLERQGRIEAVQHGHSSIGITGDTYQHVSRGLDRQAADRVASFILEP
jgi:hypothetical protein